MSEEKNETTNQDITAEIDAAIEENASLEQKEEKLLDMIQDREVEGQTDEGRGEEQTEEEQVEEEIKEQEEEEQAEEEEPEKPALPKFSNEALTRAVQVGLSVEDAQAFPSEQALLNVVNATERMYAAAADKMIAQQKPQEPEEPEEDDPLKFIDELDSEEFGEDGLKVVHALAKVARDQRSELQRLRAQQQQSLDAGEQARRQELIALFDTSVEGLGKDFHDSLGVGSYDSLPAGSAKAKRDAIANEIHVKMLGYHAAHMESPPFEQLFKQAARLVLADEYAAIEKNKLQAELKRRSKQHMQRAKGKGTETDTTKSPEDQIAEELNKRFSLSG